MLSHSTVPGPANTIETTNQIQSRPAIQDQCTITLTLCLDLKVVTGKEIDDRKRKRS